MVEFRKKVTFEPPMAEKALDELWAFPRRARPVSVPTTVEVVARNRVFRERIEFARGDPWSPESIMTDEEMAEKFRVNAVSILKDSDAWKNKVNKAIEVINGLEELKDITELTKLLSP